MSDFNVKDLNKAAKIANQQMRRLEKAGIKSPAYESVQAILEMMGAKPTASGGRRFREVYKAPATKEEARFLRATLKQIKAFQGAKTSTVQKARRSQSQSYNTADKKYNLRKLGITKDKWFRIWKNLPDDRNARLLGSEEVIAITKEYNRVSNKNNVPVQDRLTVDEIVKLAESKKDLGEVLNETGITLEGYTKMLN